MKVSVASLLLAYVLLGGSYYLLASQLWTNHLIDIATRKSLEERQRYYRKWAAAAAAAALVPLLALTLWLAASRLVPLWMAPLLQIVCLIPGGWLLKKRWRVLNELGYSQRTGG